VELAAPVVDCAEDALWSVVLGVVAADPAALWSAELGGAEVVLPAFASFVVGGCELGVVVEALPVVLWSAGGVVEL
jgi:hypothetical protein